MVEGDFYNLFLNDSNSDSEFEGFDFGSMYIYIYISPTLLHKQYETIGQFEAEFYRFEFRVFLLLDRLPY